MKKLFFFCSIIFYGLAYSQPISQLPTTTTGASGDFLIKNDAAGGTGATKKISVANFITTYSLSTGSGISGLTTNKYTKATSATTIGDALLSDDGTNIIVPSGKKITGATTSAIQLDFGTTGSPYFQITPDAGGYATSAYYQDVDGISLSWNGTNDGSIFIDDSRTTMVKTSLGKKWGLSVAKNAFYDGIKGGIYIADNSTASFTEPGFDQAAAVSINSKSSTVNSGVKNSVILGGTSLTASADNTAYMQNANFSGTIGAGTWNGSVIGSTYGGTGVNNGGRTLTLNTNNAAFTFGGAYTLTVPATGTATLGTGTTNALTKWTGTNTVGASSVVSDDGTNLILGSGKYITSADGTSGLFHFGTNSEATMQYTSGSDAGSVTINSTGVEASHTDGSSTSNFQLAASNIAIGGSSGVNLTIGGTGNNNIIEGNLRLILGSEGASKVLTSDASGNATWQTPSGGSGTVTSIATGNGITGGTITTTGTLGLSGATGDIGSFSGTNTYSAISAVATGYLLGSQGVSTKPAWLQAATLNTSLTTPLIQGSTSASGTLTLRSTSDATDGNILFQTDGTTERMRIASDGNVSIGTTTTTHKLTVAAGSLTTGTNIFSFTGTLPSSGGTENGSTITVTSAGSTTNNRGMLFNLGAGATGSKVYTALEINTGVAGSGTDLKLSTSFTNPTANTSVTNFTYATTTGSNIGSYSESLSGNYNAGLIGKAVTAKASTTNVGVIGVGRNSNATSPIEVGVFGYLGTADNPTLSSAAILADNGSTTNPIFLARDNGSTAFTIADGGKVTVTAPINLKSYTVATLPAGVQGDMAYVTDATAPTYLGALVGGGAVVCPVFYNGSAWVSH